MSEQLKVSIDIDDVLFPTADMIMAYYEREYGVVIPPSEFYSTDPATWGVEEYITAIQRVDAYLHSDEFRHHEPIEHAVEGTTKLREAGVYLLPLTGRGDSMQAITKASLDTFFPGIFNEGATFSNYFSSGKKKRSKGDICKELGVEYHIDDHVPHLNSLARHAIRGVLYGEHAWSSSYKTEGIVLPASNWLVAPDVILDDWSRRQEGGV